MTKISGSGSIIQRHGSADPDQDPHPKCHGSATPVPIRDQEETTPTKKDASFQTALSGTILICSKKVNLEN
jgi:hypothetical protein